MVITNSHKFFAPTDLTLNAGPFKKVLLVGSCTVSFSAHHFKEIYGIETTFIHVGLIENSRTDISGGDFDFQLSSIPMDHIMHLNSYLGQPPFDKEDAERRFQESLASMFRLLEALLRFNQEFGLLTIVSNFLVPQQNPLGRLMPRNDLRNPVYYIEKLNEKLSDYIDQINNAYVIDVNAIASSIGKRHIQDDSIWKLSHAGIMTDQDFRDFEAQRNESNQRIEPITSLRETVSILPDEFYRTLCAESVAIARTARQVDSVKIVIIDLDDTLWRGVIAEEKSSLDHNFLFEGLHYGFLEALSFLRQRGILLAIASKNDHDKIADIWQELFQHRFPLSNFVSVKINWSPKSESVAEILNEVNLLPRNAVFVDDNPREREEVRAAFPDIRILGAEPYAIRRVLLWSSETQVAHITKEALGRSEMVQKQIAREIERKTLSKEEFLHSLSVKLSCHRIKDASHPLFKRAHELLNKTNQFNTTGKRWDEMELNAVMKNGGVIYAFEVQDRFTKYGAVVIAVCAGDELPSFVMSCRVIGLEVELAALILIAEDMKRRGSSELRGQIIETDANVLSRDLYARGGFQIEGSHWVLPLNTALQISEHISIDPVPELT
ncbi:HAD-IIIC family phosphatase [Nitrospirillum sp. BR 11828]|uniref:HAD-IIIC family phosphatase n=1 Tax=Nitrospirillum sp. BR 11828 TaxID=3104325 RepID=UPI002ACA385D|nr:HAD-IIIC family phosphatase [Nitrospirillum sp. BR 11828]MDZ5645624.1 HAD-IIIC family phosphatase [Nitrospirillum sp. BR 11828]